MTDEEMAEKYRKSLKQKLIDEDEFERLEMFDENVEEAYLAGLKAGRSKWHDLSKTNDDFPLNTDPEKELNNVKKWYYVKDGYYPKKTGVYLVAWKRTHHVEEYGEWGFDVDVFNADDGYFEGCGDFVIAWKEITLPKKE